MVLFSIPDIRLFWSSDPRFLSQFKAGVISTFKPYSRYPPCYKDFSFWTAPGFHENDFCEVVRDVAGDLVEGVQLVRLVHLSPRSGIALTLIFLISISLRLTNFCTR
jgi:phenylalanyl-tRNA synthetase alpha chain